MSNLHKKQVYAGLMEILKDHKYYYYSNVGDNYSKLSDDGKSAIIEYIEQVAPVMVRKEQQEFEARAKLTVWKNLTD